MSGKPAKWRLFSLNTVVMHHLTKRCSVVVALLILTAARMPIEAADRSVNWASFRNGGASTVAGQLPQEWTPEDGISWQHETDGYGQSAPIIFNDRVFVTSVIGETKETCAVTAYELETGEQAWQSTVPASQPGPSNYMNSRAAPTPVADGKGVYAFFETGNLIAINHDGEQLWKRDLAKDYGPFESNHGLGSSAAQTDELVILNIEHKGPSALLAINKQDGTTQWKVERPSGSCWTTPVVIAESGQVVVSSAGSLTGYEAASGTEIWTQDGLEGNSVPSPCVVGQNIFVGARIPEFGSAADAAKSNLCIVAGSDSPQIRWRAKTAVCDYASPVVDGGQVYFLNNVGVLSCVDAETGEGIYRKRLHAECWATPVVAENGIYFFAKDGSVKVVQRGREFAVVATNRLWDAEHPPKPEKYREAKGSHGHGAHGGSAARGGGARSEGGRAGGMIAAMMKSDANGDGVLQESEISSDFRPMLKRVDTNGDGSLDQEELAAMAKSFAERRKNSQASSRDPIAYAVAAVPGAIVVRSGTRLYCVGSPNEELSQ